MNDGKNKTEDTLYTGSTWQISSLEINSLKCRPYISLMAINCGRENNFSIFLLINVSDVNMYPLFSAELENYLCMQVT